jgi:cytoskeletal protein CcmA (bactofilin family)
MAFQGQSTKADQYPSSENKESLIARDLVVEGKIEGTGHVRIAGRFKGEASVKGNLTIEQSAHVTGEIRAESIFIRGEVKGNLHATLNGDLKASALTVAAGSRMSGKVDFGFDQREADKKIPI